VPVITARTRADLAFATGYAHAQDRFFQMDLARRLGRGELSELFGPVAVKQDTRARRFDFRAVAKRVLEAAPPAERAIVEAYARGVNAGLGGLDTRPWEYLLLRASPRAWLPEDSVLVVHSMWWQLQYNSIVNEIARRRIERAAAAAATPVAARELVTFVYAGHGEWDTPNYAADARCLQAACAGAAQVLTQPLPALLRFAMPAPKPGDEEAKPGSNSWAVAGIHTRSGVALVANDMHLDLGVPAVWYPARLRTTDEPAVDVTGVTLPGTPAVAAGSNGHVAWGFTNSYGDFVDVRFGPCTSPEYGVRRAQIVVRGAATVQVEYRDVGAGVVLDGDEYADDVARGSCPQVGWMAMRVAATNFALLGIERATRVDDVLALAPGVGIPAQNLVVGDREGRIAWTVLGRVARTSGADRYFGALEFRDAGDHPRLAGPAGGPALDRQPARGRWAARTGAGRRRGGRRRRRLRHRRARAPDPRRPAGAHASRPEGDMLGIQLDARALFVARWREQLLALVDEAAMQASPRRREFRELVSHWKPEAAPDSVGYRLVRAWRGNVLDTLWAGLHRGIVRRAARAAPAGAVRGGRLAAGIRAPDRSAAAGRRRLARLPAAQLDDTIATTAGAVRRSRDCTYGSREPVAVRHPLSRAVPWLSRLLDMPTARLPATTTCRACRMALGASERFAVSPGREAEGYLELPGGLRTSAVAFLSQRLRGLGRRTPTPFLPGRQRISSLLPAGRP
jgi:penicillin amidase